MESLGAWFFYAFAASLVLLALNMIRSPNPIHSALYLVLSMLGLAGAYFHLSAEFIAGVQVIVYAGAVMVLFVMVIMLFDLQRELRAFSKGVTSSILKIASAAAVFGYVANVVFESHPEGAEPGSTLAATPEVTRELSTLLYTNYLLAFEVLGVLLLVVAVGVVAISRVRGGTHARHS
jgi:NADH-quinone oxidoreductase subunit J